MNLSLGKTICELRKKKDMSQKQLATLLHVSNVAVSKWENNNAYPDITLLGPLARCLDISVDELLNFHSSLENTEIEELKKRISKLYETGEIDDAIKTSQQFLNEYPTDLTLKFQIGSLYFRYAAAKFDEAFADEQMERALILFEQALQIEDREIHDASKYMLISLYSAKGNYEQALALIDTFPQHTQNIGIMKSTILFQKGETKESMKIDQGCIWSELNELRLNIISLAKSYRQLNDMDNALKLIDKGLSLSNLFEVDDLISININLYLLKIELLLDTDRKQEALSVLIEITKCLKSYQTCPQNNHPIFNLITLNITMSKAYMVNNLLLLFEQNDKLNVLKKETAYKELIKTFESF